MAALTATSISDPGQKLGTVDLRALFLRVFSSEVLTAFTRTSTMMNKHIVRTISSGN